MIRRILITLALLVAAIAVGLILAVPTASQTPVSPPDHPSQITPEIVPISTIIVTTPPAATPAVPVSPIEQPTPTLKKPTLGDDPAPWVWSEGEETETPDRGFRRIIVKVREFNPWGLRGQ
jgi:hypothetical protein